MSWAIVGGAAVMGGFGLLGSWIQGEAAGDADDTQAAAAGVGIDETRRQFDAMQALLAPYVETGTDAMGQQRALAGLDGPEAQAAAMKMMSDSPEMMALTQQGENAILQQGSATGGLRGGNVQGALAQFRPQMLSGLINQQYGRLGGLTQMGQASAAGVGAAGMQTGANIADLLGQQGAAIAGGQLAQGQAAAAPFQLMSNLGGMYAMKGMGIF